MSGKVAKKLAESLYVMYCTLLLGFICSFFSKHVDKGKHLNVLCGISDSSSLFNVMQVMHIDHCTLNNGVGTRMLKNWVLKAEILQI